MQGPIVRATGKPTFYITSNCVYWPMSPRLMVVGATASSAELGVVQATYPMGPIFHFLSLLLESSYSLNTCGTILFDNINMNGCCFNLTVQEP